jgi:hypothetical protein
VKRFNVGVQSRLITTMSSSRFFMKQRAAAAEFSGIIVSQAHITK